MLLRRRYFLLTLWILISCKIYSQTSFDPEKRPKDIISLPAFTVSQQLLPYAAVIIRDARYDTSKFGYTDGKILKRAVTSLSFEKAIDETLGKSLTGKLDQKSNYRVYMFIKHFWIDGMPEKRINQTFCKAQIETFLQLDTVFYPLFRFDTSFVATKQSMSVGEVVLSPFKSCIEKISNLSADSIIKMKRKLSITAVLNSYKKTREYPQLKQSSMEKGVYFSYQDFLNNKKSHPALRYEQTLYTDDLYITENGQETLLKEFWGFCDGKKNFMRLGQNFYELHRQNQSFELHGPSSIDLLRRKEGGRVPSTGLGTATDLAAFGIYGSDESDLLLFKPMQLNMETGKPYGF